MSIETRHTEKTMLFRLLMCKHSKSTVKEAIAQLVATMEPEDVKLVEQQIQEYLDDLDD